MDKLTKGRVFTGISQVKSTVATEFQTPHEVAEYMASLVPDNCKSILEPTPGIGNIVRACKKRGFNVTAAEDFFSLTDCQYDAVVMNPPFSTKFAFNVPENFEHAGMRLGYYMLTECMKKTNYVIALMPWFTISDSDLRLRFIKNYGLKSVTALPRKTFKYARIQTCILELERGFKGSTHFKVFDFKNFQLSTLNF